MTILVVFVTVAYRSVPQWLPIRGQTWVRQRIADANVRMRGQLKARICRSEGQGFESKAGQDFFLKSSANFQIRAQGLIED